MNSPTPSSTVAAPSGNRRPISGGELRGESRQAFLDIRRLIIAEEDVHSIHALAQRADGKFLYFIETPFPTWPKFVIGLTDSTNENVEVLFRCGARWSADAEWHRIRHGQKPSPSEF